MTTVSFKEAAILSYLAKRKNLSTSEHREFTVGLKGEALKLANTLTRARSPYKTSRLGVQTSKRKTVASNVQSVKAKA